MASAVFEALEDSPQWQGLPIRVLPGVTAMLAAAAREERADLEVGVAEQEADDLAAGFRDHEGA